MELVFIPAAAIGHLVSQVEFAKRLLDKDDRFSVTVLIIDPLRRDSKIQTYVGSLAASDARLRFINFPQIEADPLTITKRPDRFLFDFLESHKLNIKEYIINHVLPNYAVSAAWFVVDAFTTPMIDVANELGLPSYVFYTSGAASLGFGLHVATRYDQVGKAIQASDGELVFPSYANPVPCKVMPSVSSDENDEYTDIINFIRFLWSLPKRSPRNHGLGIRPSNCTDLKEILPEGFLQRTEGRGMICGWAPQIEVLAHKSIGGFVSHCGWNSILESLWYGVPIVTWPMHSEQQLNAFQMVKDLGLAVEMRLDYKLGESDVVMADEIGKGINCLMDGDSEVRKKVKKMSEVSRKAVNNSNGSSFTSYARLIDSFFVGNANIKS